MWKFLLPLVVAVGAAALAIAEYDSRKSPHIIRDLETAATSAGHEFGWSNLLARRNFDEDELDSPSSEVVRRPEDPLVRYVEALSAGAAELRNKAAHQAYRKPASPPLKPAAARCLHPKIGR
jgi:hypothetical protein